MSNKLQVESVLTGCQNIPIVEIRSKPLRCGFISAAVKGVWYILHNNSFPILLERLNDLIILKG